LWFDERRKQNKIRHVIAVAYKKTSTPVGHRAEVAGFPIRHVTAVAYRKRSAL